PRRRDVAAALRLPRPGGAVAPRGRELRAPALLRFDRAAPARIGPARHHADLRRAEEIRPRRVQMAIDRAAMAEVFLAHGGDGDGMAAPEVRVVSARLGTQVDVV